MKQVGLVEKLGLIFIAIFMVSCKLNDNRISGTLGRSPSSEPSTISVEGFSVIEGDSDQVYDNAFRVFLDRPLGVDLSLELSTSDITATNSSDYSVGESFVVVPAGSLEAYISVTVKGDIQGEGDESFSLSLVNLPADLKAGTVTALGTIIENDPIVLEVEAMYPNNGANWLDYIGRDYTRKFDAQQDVSFPFADYFSRPYSDTINGGEVRKVKAIGQHSCDGLSMVDELDGFNWSCSSREDPVFFYSRGLKDGKGLKDLLDPNSFKANRVFLKKNAVTLAESPLSSSWWSNPVVSITLNSGGSDPPLDLTSSGTLYTLSVGGVSRGIRLLADRTALVVLGSQTLSMAGSMATDCNTLSVGNQPCLVYVGNAQQGWIEGNFSGDLAYPIIRLGSSLSANPQGWRLHRLNMSGSSYTRGLELAEGNSFYISEFNSVGGGTAIYISQPKWGLIRGAKIRDCSAGISSGVNAWYLYIDQVQISHCSSHAANTSGFFTHISNSRIYSNGGTGINALTATGLVVDHTIIVNNLGDGLDIREEDSRVHHLTVANNGSYGLQNINIGGATSGVEVKSSIFANNAIGILNSGDSATYRDILVADNGVGITIDGTSAENSFKGKLILGNLTNDCDVTSSGSNPGLGGSGSCALQGASEATISTGVSLANYFGGSVGLESVNSHSSGIQLTSLISDWFLFENPFRVWGKEGSSLNSGIRAECQSAQNCRIWDWTLSASASHALNAYGTLIDKAICPSSIQGDNFFIYLRLFEEYGLLHAKEIIGDEIGNEDGVCNSNENCLFSPHIGAAQGLGGTLSSCIFQNGVTLNGIKNVKMFFYQ